MEKLELETAELPRAVRENARGDSAFSFRAGV